MVIFEDIQDVEDWLAPLDYVDFWEAIAPYGLFPEDDRDHCDGLIAAGKVPQETILQGLKAMFRIEFCTKLDLKDRIHDPVTAQYLTGVH